MKKDEKMKSLHYTSHGDASVLTLRELNIPKIEGDNKIAVKTIYSSLNAVDWKYRRGYFSTFTHVFKTKLGYDIIGEIVDLSSNIKSHKKGDIVMGVLPTLQGGAHSEYTILTDKQCIVVSSSDNIMELAGLPMAGITAWLALFKIAKLSKGKKVLINGGSSGVGHLAIQLSKIYGAEVTSVSSKKNENFCKNLGADITIDYQSHDFTTLKEKYDIVFDVVANSSIRKVKKILKPSGYYINTNISLKLVFDILFNQKVKFVYVTPDMNILKELYDLFINGKIKVHIDKCFKFSDFINAHQYIEQSRTIGKVIINMQE